MTDRITLKGLRARGRHGVLPTERAEGQDFLVDVVLELDLSAAARDDDLAKTVDYGVLAGRAGQGDHRRAGRPDRDARRPAGRRLPRRRAGADGDGHRAQAARADPARVRRRRGPPAAREGGALTRAVLSLGSNLGDRLAHLRAAVAELEPVLVSVSGVYETPPWGDPDQPSYLNAAVAGPGRRGDRSGLARPGPARSRAAEGRVRDPERQFGPRTLDVDVIAVFDADGQPVRQRRPGADPAAPAGPPAGVRAPAVGRPRSGGRAARPRVGSTDLLRAEPAAGDVAAVRARPDLRIQSAG